MTLFIAPTPEGLDDGFAVLAPIGQFLLAGELLIDTATTWPLLMELEGNMTVTGEQSQGGQTIEFVGTGPMKMTRSASYGRQP